MTEACAPPSAPHTRIRLINKVPWLWPAGSKVLAPRGYPAARFWAEPIPERFAKASTYEIYTVKCNLVNALTPRCVER